MAVISEQLQITDSFSAVFQRFNQMANQISGSLERIDRGFEEYTRVSDRAEERTQRITDSIQASSLGFNALSSTVTQSSNQISESLERINGNLEEYIRANDRASNANQRHSSQIRHTDASMNALIGTVRRFVAAIGGMAAIKGILSLSDELTQTQARLDAINDGLQDSEQLNKMIFASAQSARGSYLDMAQNVAALKAQTGEVFNSTAEAVRFTELLNKQFAISGTSASGVASTMYNLTQALATGVLRGNDLQMVLSNSPALVQRISQYMGITVGELRELASQGKITADIVKNAILENGDKIDRAFKKMPMTFGQAMQKVKNTAIMGFQPVGQAIADAIKSPEFDQAINAISQGVLMVTVIGLRGFEALGNVIKFCGDNMNILAPILGVIVGALVAYNAAMAISTAVTAAQSFADGVLGAARMFQAGATFSATVAQNGFNAALAACPITWIILAIMAVIAVVVALIVTFHNLAQTGHTIFGDIAGVVLGCFSVIQNALAIVANGFISAAEWIVNAWNDMVFNIQTFFYNLAVSAINVFNSVIDAADGAATAIANAFISGINQAIGAINTLVDALNNVPGFSLGKVGTLGSVSSVISGRISTAGLTAPTKADQVSFGRFETQSFGDAFQSGFDKGSAWGDSVQNDLMSGFNGIKDQFNSLMGGSSLGDIASGMDGLGEAAGAGAGGSGGGGGRGKTNVGTVDKVKDVTLSDEDLKIYRDLAERRYMTQLELKTLAPNISVSIPESAAKNLTSEDVANKLKVMLIEQMNSHTAVSHAN